MSAGATFDYDFGQKRHWRRWNWNRICERLPVKPSEAVVLFLAGKEHHDRHEALKRGFSPSNLIAVDRSVEVVELLRKQGQLCLHGDIFDVVINWPSRPFLNVVAADLCGGLGSPEIVTKMMLAWSSPAFGGAFSLNLLRGRDAHARSCIAEGNTKHRGLWFIWFMFFELQRGKPEDWKTWLKCLRPAFNSYRSSAGLTFDSVVADNNHSIADAKDFNSCAAPFVKPSLRRQIAAVLAHRTIRSRN